MEDLEKRLSEEPIRLPPHPFLDSMLTFGRDEAISGAVNITANTVGGIFLRGKHDAILAATGLTIEKIGLFGWYFKEAIEIRNSTPIEDRKSILNYANQVFKAGLPTLVKDLTIHDPLDYVLMYSALKNLPNTPTFMISLSSFVLAVIGASALDVAHTEAKYHLLKKKLHKNGFDGESYIEARFFIRSEEDRDKLLEDISKKFSLGDYSKWQYHDNYLPCTLPSFNGREPKIRLRERISDEETIKSCQFVFTQFSESQSKGGVLSRPRPEQFRYFISRKNKLYYPIISTMPHNLDDIESSSLKKLIGNYTNSEEKIRPIHFQREYVRDNELLVSVDRIEHERPFYVLELKVHKDTDYLKEAMRYVMHEFSPLMTTHSKPELLKLNNI